MANCHQRSTTGNRGETPVRHDEPGNSRRITEVAVNMGRVFMSLFYIREMLERLHAAPPAVESTRSEPLAVTDIA